MSSCPRERLHQHLDAVALGEGEHLVRRVPAVVRAVEQPVAQLLPGLGEHVGVEAAHDQLVQEQLPLLGPAEAAGDADEGRPLGALGVLDGAHDDVDAFGIAAAVLVPGHLVRPLGEVADVLHVHGG